MVPKLDLNNSMPKDTINVFKELSKYNFIKKYTLIGGTALSIQIHHRLSEDLDFIIDNETINNPEIKREINKIFLNYKIIRDDKDYQLDFIINNCKVTFIAIGTIAIPFKIKKESFSYQNINIARIDIIAVLKLSAIAQRNTIRDYYDLYYISKYKLSFSKIVAKTKHLNPNLSPITYSETIIYTKDIPENSIENHLNPKENVSKKQIETFFISELKKINK